ncbi:nitroreductase family protein [Gottschalkiaceae bacterium SANA]|nr:nitroreductase family protein [Gottschalkiaceae bacterium SANA]
MNFLELAKRRYSVRSYTPQKVEEDKLKLILQAAHVAPTGGNRQPQHLIVIQSQEGLEKLGKAANTFDAPLAILVCSDKEKAWKRPYDDKTLEEIDASIVTDHMMLQATDLGLGSLWICKFEPNVLREEFKLPSNLQPINLLVIGYAKGEKKSPNRHDRDRKPLSEVVSYESI